ncbi:MAG TPA: GlsB/YeaQ/YmgE family stress response membrane protein [Blastocatellia bacterium]|jgi:uncharacterized membrane protein YeaQ/YmgE (transglycosylase-associated protein family)|nr:GlsB/YeaQ/YmgE family stress response membrane protein [Blastocatellia bacterium]
MGWVISSLIMGVIVGALARFLMPGQDKMGCFMTALLGIGGSFLGGFIATLIWRDEVRTGFKPAGFLMSLAGALILLGIWRLIRGKQK